MSNLLAVIPLNHLAIAFIPVSVVIIILFKWSLNGKYALYALSRMLVQLLLVGYFLSYLFASANAWIVGLMLIVMVLFSSWIALGNIKEQRLQLLKWVIVSIAIGGCFTLFIITQGY